ncbi:hypothetical protein D9619_007482 [Psilocybe cf. subviscida]|uniref:Transmembrane protein n=1 Tax=Psilocybe cf. subviscida TaxID=2480587 RepID=A0A8H5B2G2_9AGAR|nr:hypothetical protein D9619_007482 [Psilocybe cf. subviscida]
MPTSHEVLLFSLTPRLYFARTAIIASLWIITVSIPWLLFPVRRPVGMYITLFALITVHHTATLMSLKWFFGIVDIPLLVLEIIGVAFYGTELTLLPSWIPETLTFHAVLVWMAFGSLVGLFLLRIATIVRSKGRVLITPFDICADQPSPLKEKYSFINLLFGRSIWSVQFAGEQRQLRIFRGSLGLIFLCTLLFWILEKVIFQPMQETALGPIKEYRSLTPPLKFINSIENPVWNILFPVPLNDTDNPAISPEQFFQAVQVNAIWNEDFVNASNGTAPECTNASSIFRNDPDDGPDLYVYSFLCQNGTLFDTQGDQFAVLPDLLINISFAILKPDPPMINPTSFQQVSHIIIGLTNSTDSVKNIIHRTVPFAMTQGVNVAASIIPDVRQVYSRPALAAFGILQTTSQFWASRIIATYHDPFAGPFDPDVSTLRLFLQDNWSETRIIQDYRENSVIVGLANVGGLWTTFSGIFAIFFGASMLHILYGNKPLSVFGLAHTFNYQSMKEQILRQYPNILKEHQEGPHRGMLALLRDHLIDLSFIEKDHELGPSQGSNSAPANASDEEQQRVEEKISPIEGGAESVLASRPQLAARPSSVPSTSSAEIGKESA